MEPMSAERSSANSRMVAHIERQSRILRLLGGLTTAGAIVWIVLRAAFLWSAMPAHGVVDHVEQRSDSSVWHARFSYADLDGRRHTAETSFLSPSICPSLRVGNSVPVRYSATNPDDALITTADTLWIYPGFIFAVGVFFLFGGTGFRFVARLIEKRASRSGNEA
jgi:hypothetical protein